MPVRPRRQRRALVEWTPAFALALTIGPAPGQRVPSDAVLRRTWEAVGGYLLAGYAADRRPWAWWRWHPGVPEELRVERLGLIPIEHAERVQAERDDLEARRAAWLAERAGAGMEEQA